MNDISTLLLLVKRWGWCVVVSLSSGGGWKIPSDSAVTKKIFEKLSAMTSDYIILPSRNFTDNEAKVFIEHFEIDIKTLEKSMDVANNPHILRIFAHTLDKSHSEAKQKYTSCRKS